MSLVQLLSRGNQDHNRQNRSIREYKNVISEQSPGWNKQMIFYIDRDSFTTLNKMRIRIKVAPAPEGFRWKRLWSLRFIKSMKLYIGETCLFETNSETLQMKYLIDGLKTKYDHSSELLPTHPLSVFDLSEEERTRISLESHEVSFEPFCFD